MTAPATESPSAARSVPVISPAPLVPVADFGPVDRLNGWTMTAVITALAALTRFLNLGSPTDAGTPIFDEKHYAPQAWQMLHNHGVEDNPGYGLVVHPPVGKQLIAIGEAIFGYNGLGWRFTGAVLGVIMVALVARIARRMSRSTMVGAIAGLLLIADGVSFVTSRTALLDGFLAFFIVAAFGALIVDRDQVRERMHVALLEGRIGETQWGPRLGVRWWRFGAGVLLGLACATKWSGLYFVVFFGLMTLAFDVAARRQYRVPRPWLGTLRRDLGPAVYALGLIPFGVYLASYAPWFASETATNRHEVGQSIGPGGFLPDAFRSLWHYTYGVYRFHSGLTNADGNHHPWESKPWTWPMSLRPVLYAIDQENISGCGAQSCVKAVMLVGTPAMWFIAVPVLGWALWRTFVKKDWRYGAHPGRLQRGLPAVVRRHRPADVLLLRRDHGAVPGNSHRHDPRGHIASAEPEPRATNAWPHRRELLCRDCDHELRLDVSDPHRHTDFGVDVEHADLAAQLAVAHSALSPVSTPRSSFCGAGALSTALTSISALGRSAVGPCGDQRRCAAIPRLRSRLAAGVMTRGAVAMELHRRTSERLPTHGRFQESLRQHGRCVAVDGTHRHCRGQGCGRIARRRLDRGHRAHRTDRQARQTTTRGRGLRRPDRRRRDRTRWGIFGHHAERAPPWI